MKYALVFLFLFTVVASAAPVTISGGQGSLAASVTFDRCGAGLLCATLTNTSPNDVMDPSEVLTGVYWDSETPLSLTPVSAILSNGSYVVFGSTDPGGVVGGEWGYVPNLSGQPGTYAIGSAGYIPGSGYWFPGSNLQGPTSLDGLQYGILPFADNQATGNTPVTGTNALIVGGVSFTLSGLPENYDLGQIKNVWFQYGTSLDDPGFGGGHSVPEPGTITMLLSGAVILLAKKFL